MKRFLRALPVMNSQGDFKVLQILSLVVIVGAMVIPAEGTGFSICLFYNLTGLPCPGCGLTRSVTHSLHGGMGSALLYNPFGPLIALIVVFFAASALVRPVTDFYHRYEKPIMRSLFVMGILLVLFGVARAILLARDPDALRGLTHSFQDPRLHDFFINLIK